MTLFPLLKLLHLFWEQPFPLAIDRLLDLAQVRDEEISEAALWALGNLTDPRIRAVALQMRADGEAAIGAVNLLRNNFRDGDYGRITRMLSETGDADDFHRLGMTVRDIIQAHPIPEAKSTLNILYRQGRCVLCRQRATALLTSLGPLPPWILAEGRYDADSETRAVVTNSAAT